MVTGMLVAGTGPLEATSHNVIEYIFRGERRRVNNCIIFLGGILTISYVTASLPVCVAWILLISSLLDHSCILFVRFCYTLV